MVETAVAAAVMLAVGEKANGDESGMPLLHMDESVAIGQLQQQPRTNTAAMRHSGVYSSDKSV